MVMRYYVAAILAIEAELHAFWRRRHIFLPDTYERILRQRFLGEGGEAVHTFSKIDRLRRDQHTHAGRRNDHVTLFTAART